MKNDNGPVAYNGNERADINYHHGALKPAVGVHNWQVFRANRKQEHGWTYNHAPMLAWWNNRFFIEFLSNPEKEHVPPGRTLLTTSCNGFEWEKPRVAFPSCPLQEGDDIAVMHQRMGFYISTSNRLFTLGFYGISPQPDILPFDKNGIGRVIREIYSDNSFGPIYFIRIMNHAGWNESNTPYPFFEKSEDEGFKEACREVLGNSLITQQWLEEHGDNDELISLKGNYQAFCYYNISDKETVGLWKWSKNGLTDDGGKTWHRLGVSPSLEMSGSKVWGQRTSDGRFALMYNPSTDNKHRWPLAIVTSSDGLVFSNMLLVNGEVPPIRYPGGEYKNFGQNYVRGIAEYNKAPLDGDIWVTYSMNKEDIWISRIPVPVKGNESEPVDHDFTDMKPGGYIKGWNIYSPMWAPVTIDKFPGSNKNCLKIMDMDLSDYAKAERIFKESNYVVADFGINADQNKFGQLFIEMSDCKGKVPMRMILDNDGYIKIRHGRGTDKVQKYESGKWYSIKMTADAKTNMFTVSINDRVAGENQSYQGIMQDRHAWYFFASVDSLQRIVFRTAPIRRKPDVDDVSEDLNDTVENYEDEEKPVVYYISHLKIK